MKDVLLLFNYSESYVGNIITRDDGNKGTAKFRRQSKVSSTERTVSNPTNPEIRTIKAERSTLQVFKVYELAHMVRCESHEQAWGRGTCFRLLVP